MPGLRWLLLALLLSLTVACSAPSPPLQAGFRELDLDFPIYPPAEPYLRYQKRLRAYKKPPPPPRYTAKNERIFRELEKLKAISEAQIAYRNRLKAAAAAARKPPADMARWERYQARLARIEKAQVIREAQKAAAGQAYYSNRFVIFEKRLNRLEKEDVADSEQFEDRRHQALTDSTLEHISRQGQTFINPQNRGTSR